jgi:cyclopropane-fatty-acyl-phospholipid synthase
MKSKEKIQEILNEAGVDVDRNDDLKVLDDKFYDRVLFGGTLALGESYMDGWWESKDISRLVYKALRADLARKVFRHFSIGLIPHFLKHTLMNLQIGKKAYQVGKEHYDIGNELYERMLGKTMSYTCGYWKDINNLDDAQTAKLDLICKKLNLKKGQRVLDIGCGWGNFMKYASENYGVECVGLSVSEEQTKLGRERCKGLPVKFVVTDYLKFESEEKFDFIVSIEMFEAVGYKNFSKFFSKAANLLKEDGLFLLQTIANNRTAWRADPWFDKYIFPNGYLPSPRLLTKAIEGKFMIEDWHNFGADYDKTLVAWENNFESSWEELIKLNNKKYDTRFYRMWKYYLKTMQGAFRARYMNLWQIVLSKNGVKGGYSSVR